MTFCIVSLISENVVAFYITFVNTGACLCLMRVYINIVILSMFITIITGAMSL